MKNLIPRIICLLVLTAAVSCSKDENEGARLVGEPDREFVLNAADEGLFQISAGQVALNNGASEKYAAFGQMIIENYTVSNQELQSYAAEKKISIPTTLSDNRQLRLDSLAGRRGVALDTVFASAMIATHSETIQYFESQADVVTDSQLKTWIDKKLPQLRQYLDRAKALNDTLQ